MQETQKLKERLDQARSEVEIAQRQGDLARASELLYGVIPDIEKKLAAASDGKLVNEAVTERADRRRWSRAGPAFRSTR